MWLPGSYQNGFAPRDGEALYPQLWPSSAGAWASCLGPTGVTLRDQSSYGNHGTLTNMDPATDWAVSGGRWALDFDGANDYVASIGGLSSYSFIQNTGIFSISAWIKLASLTRGVIIAGSGSSAEKGFFLMFETAAGFGANALRMWGSRGIDASNLVFDAHSGDNSFTDLNWHHVMVVAKSATNITFFVDGIAKTTTYRVASTGLSSGNATRTVLIGGINSASPPTLPFAGLIDDVLVYSSPSSTAMTALLARRRGIAYERSERRRAKATGITPDASSNSGYQAASASYSWSHTNAGNFLAVDVSRLSVPGTTVTGITYNGDALVNVGVQASGTDAGNVSMWRMVAPDVGTFDITVTLSAVAISAGTAVSYFNAHQTTPTEGFNGATAVNGVGASDAEVTITSAANNCWIHAALATTDTDVTAEQNARNEVTGAGGVGANEDTGPVTPAGATVMSYTDIAGLATWVIAGYAIRPVTASGASGSGQCFNSGAVFSGRTFGRRALA